MALRFLVDGYNVIHQIPQLDHGKLESQRLGLVKYIEHGCPQGSIKNKVTIVFDGQGGGGFGSAPLSSLIEVVFSVGESADEKIKRIVDQSKNARNIVVVSDDRDIQIAVRKSGAQVVSVGEFLSRCRNKPDAKKAARDKPGTASKKTITHTDEFKITSEMSKLWLK